jgi:transcriptional regulator with XRE-family HTH domain
MFVKIFEAICEANGVSPSKVLDAVGMNRSSYTGWKQGAEPTNETKKKIADYFGLTVRQLMAGDIDESPAGPARTDVELAEILREFRDSPELRTLFSVSKGATPEQLRQYAEVIKALRGTYRD